MRARRARIAGTYEIFARAVAKPFTSDVGGNMHASSFEALVGRRAGALTRSTGVMPRLLALATVIVALGVFAQRAEAFGVTNFQASPSTRQAGAHPNIVVGFQRIGTNGEDLRDVQLELPAGQQLNPEAVPEKCTAARFAADNCPAGSQIGSVSLAVNLEVLVFSLPMTASGSAYVLEPGSADHGQLGYVIRPRGFAKSLFKQSLRLVRTTASTTADSSLATSLQSLNLPRMWGSTNIAVRRMSLAWSGRAGADRSGAFFTLNPSGCGSATTALTAVSYQGERASRTYSWTPSNCSLVPFSPAVEFAVDDPAAGAATGLEMSVALPAASGSIEQSALRSASYLLPEGTSLNSTATDPNGGVCSPSEFAADSCPSESLVGAASASLPFFAPVFVGDVFATERFEQGLSGVAVLRGARGMRFDIEVTLTNDAAASVNRVRIDWEAVPQVRIGDMSIQMTEPLVRNPVCPGAPQVVDVAVASYSGRIVGRAPAYGSDPCVAPPAPPQITEPLGDSLISDATPEVSGVTEAGSEVTLLDDGAPVGTAIADGSGAWSITPSAAIGEGDSVLSATAANAGGESPPSAPVRIRVDSVAPAAPVIGLPAPGGYLDFTDVPAIVAGTAEPASEIHLFAAGDEIWSGSASALGDWWAQVLWGLPEGPTVLTATSVDQAGNVSAPSIPVPVTVRHIPWPSNVVITSGPRGGVSIENSSPTFTFAFEVGTGSTECSLDGGAWSACTSPHTLPLLAVGAHRFGVRAEGASSEPAVAEFSVAEFQPMAGVDFSTTQAAANPDLEFTVDNPVGDLGEVALELPDGFWAGVGSVPMCRIAESQYAEACALDEPGSAIGSVDLTVVDDGNTPHSATAILYAAESAGRLARLTAAFDLPGFSKYDLDVSLDARYSSDDPYASRDISDPKGVDLAMLELRGATRDGDSVHIRSIALDLNSNDPAFAIPLLHNPSSCEPGVTTVRLRSQGGSLAESAMPFQATDCEDVGFDPAAEMSFSDVARHANTTPQFVLSLQPGDSVVRHMAIDLPASVGPQYAGLAEYCPQFDLERAGAPTCDPGTTLVGAVTAHSPLLPASSPLTGEIFLEESGNVVPYLHFRLHEDALGIDMRWRANWEIVPASSSSPTHVRLVFNTDAYGSTADLPQIPLTELSFALPGSGGQGPIFRVLSSCMRVDPSARVQLESWSGAVRELTQTHVFDPACPS